MTDRPSLTRQTEAPPGPRTEAGQNYVNSVPDEGNRRIAAVNLVLAIEAEAATAERKQAERLERVIDSIQAVAHGQGAMAAAEWGLGDRRESYVTNAATRNLLKGLVREARAALTGGPSDE